MMALTVENLKIEEVAKNYSEAIGKEWEKAIQGE